MTFFLVLKYLNFYSFILMLTALQKQSFMAMSSLNIILKFSENNK